MKKYKIVVLSDLENSASIILKSTISLAKMINGEIEVFSVKKPTEIVARESQLSAMRTINNQHKTTVKKMEELIKPMAKEHGLDINYSFAFGNIKNEIKDFIEDRQPDIIVLGKRKSSPFQLIGDSVTKYVFNIFKGAIMITADKNSLEPNKEISLGMLNNAEPLGNLQFAEDLMAHSTKSLKSFKIVKKSEVSEKMTNPANSKTVEYVFQHNNGAIKSLSNYLSKSNVDLLYLNRAKKQAIDEENLMTADIKNLVKELNVTLLVTPE